MKTLLTILFLSLSALALGQTTTSKIDTAEFKTYTACNDCFDGWKNTNSESVGSPARTNRTDGSNRTQQPKSDGMVKQEGRRFLGQTLAIISSSVLAGFLILISSK